MSSIYISRIQVHLSNLIHINFVLSFTSVRRIIQELPQKTSYTPELTKGIFTIIKSTYINCFKEKRVKLDKVVTIWNSFNLVVNVFQLNVKNGHY